MKILVTGATGFIGSAVVRNATAAGHDVAALVRAEGIEVARKQFPAAVKLFPGTLQSFPIRDLEQFGADTCVHAAWIATPGVYLHAPENELWVNWSLNFLRKIGVCGTKNLLVLGTCIEYEIGNYLLSEDKTPILPSSAYARCKNELRLALEAEQQFSLCWGRVFYPYGPGEHPDRLLSSLVRKFSKRETVVLKTPSSTKDYIFIDDLSEAILAVVAKKFIGTVNFGTGEGVQIRQIARTIAEEMNRLDYVEEMSPEPIDPLGYVVADNSRLRSLGWQPKTNLREGLKKLIVSVQSGNKV